MDTELKQGGEEIFKNSSEPSVEEIDAYTQQTDTTQQIEKDLEEYDRPQEIEIFKIAIKTPVELGTIEVQVTKFDLISDIHKYLQETTETCLHTSYNLMLNGHKLNEFVEIGSIPQIQNGTIIDMVPALYNERTSRLHINRLREIMATSQEENNKSSNPSFFSGYSFTDDNEADEERQRVQDELLQKQEESSDQTNGSEEGEPKLSKKKQKAQAAAQAAQAAAEAQAKLARTGGKPTKKDLKKQQREKEMVERRQQIVEIKEYTKPRLSDFYPTTQRAPISCIRAINMSGWNPVPGFRKLAGDLFYLEIETLESREILHVTANTEGFFINSSTSVAFNPVPSTSRPALHSHNLHELLQRVSPLFSRGLRSVLKSITQRHPYEMVPAIVPSNTWIMRPPTFKHSQVHADDSNLHLVDPELRAQPRDWNEELQSLRELPKNTIQERILRDRAFVKVNADFVDAAIRGAQVVVTKSIPPINPLENERSHMFVYNNIFFSFALDTRDSYVECGGDRAARAAANNDLRGVKLFNLVDVEGISTICTAIIDYRGHRVIAQSLVPGILSNEKTSVVHYGSMDMGKTILADTEFHERLLKVASMLHLAEREVCPSVIENAPVKICTSYESKGIIGTDGRRYVLDILRATPRDPNYPEDKHQMYVLRPELVANYTEYLKMEWEDKQEKIRKRKEDLEKQKDQQQKDGNPTATEVSIDDIVLEEPPHVEFNPNLYAPCGVKLGGTQEQRDQDQMELNKIGSFLKEKMIKRLVEDFTLFNSTPVDGQTLTVIMHSRGINMRYLGLISKQCDKIPFVKELCFNEMVSRAAKHIFNETLRNSNQSEMSHIICHFLNCFLGTDTGSGILNESNQQQNQNQQNNQQNQNQNNSNSSLKESKKQRQQRLLNESYNLQMKNHSSKKRMTQSMLWKSIENSIKDKYDYEITMHSVPIESRISVLRALCLRTGLQIVAKDYDFTNDEPFALGDIIDVVCVVKHLNPRTPDGIDMLEAGKAALATKRINEASELLTEALTVCHQVHGAIHSDTANCYNNLATAAFYRDEYDQAIEFQKNALIITEKTMGVDHHDTIHAYNNLALFCQRSGRFTEAMGYLKHILYLTDLLGSEFSPERPSIYSSVAIVLQQLSQFYLAIDFLIEAIKHQRRLFGEENIISAPCLHSIAIIYAQMSDWKMAIKYERESKKILSIYLQPDHPRVKESEEYIRRFDIEARVESQQKTQFETLRHQQELMRNLNNHSIKKEKEKEGTKQSNGNNVNTPKSDDEITKLLKFVKSKESQKKKKDKK